MPAGPSNANHVGISRAVFSHHALAHIFRHFVADEPTDDVVTCARRIWHQQGDGVRGVILPGMRDRSESGNDENGQQAQGDARRFHMLYTAFEVSIAMVILSQYLHK